MLMLAIHVPVVRIWSAIMHVSLVCVINSFSLYLLYIYIYSLISLWLSIVSKEWEMKIISEYSFLDYFAKNHVRYCHHFRSIVVVSFQIKFELYMNDRLQNLLFWSCWYGSKIQIWPPSYLHDKYIWMLLLLQTKPLTISFCV